MAAPPYPSELVRHDYLERGKLPAAGDSAWYGNVERANITQRWRYHAIDHYGVLQRRASEYFGL